MGVREDEWEVSFGREMDDHQTRQLVTPCNCFSSSINALDGRQHGFDRHNKRNGKEGEQTR